MSLVDQSNPLRIAKSLIALVVLRPLLLRLLLRPLPLRLLLRPLLRRLLLDALSLEMESFVLTILIAAVARAAMESRALVYANPPPVA